MRKVFIFSFLELARIIRLILASNEDSYKLLFTKGFESFRWQMGKWKAWRVFERARMTTPAYKAFLQTHHKLHLTIQGFNPDLTGIPVMDKESYVKQYSIEDRCQYGIIPPRGVVIDESSGTSGMPNNWVRGPKERSDVKKILQLSLHQQFGDKPIFLINAFALGPWATGMNVSMSLVDIAMLKSTGPDIKKIEHTLDLFGPKYKYLIMGYPPFLKSLIDSARISWKDYTITTVFGGEGISEGMREYLSRYFTNSYGSYGASDLEINIAAENDFTIALRKLLEKNTDLKNDLTLSKGSLPMIFQYNPLDYYIESNEHHELIVTLCRLNNVAPKIRYNIHDTGHVMRFPELIRLLKKHGISPSSLHKTYTDLPLLFHYGRSDMAVAFYGCKITPSEIQDIIFKQNDLAKKVNSFALITSEDNNVNKHLTLALEVVQNMPIPSETETTEVTDIIFSTLKAVNQDYREAATMIPKGFEPKVKFHTYGTGPFVKDDIRLKKHYIQ